MVDAARIELATPAMSTQCSTTELRVHAGALSQGAMPAQAPLRQNLLASGESGAKLEQPVHLGHQIAEMERLGEHLGVAGRPFAPVQRNRGKIGRASWRERVCQYV